MSYILFVLGLLFANLNTADFEPRNEPRSQKDDRNNPGDDRRDFIITELQTP